MKIICLSYDLPTKVVKKNKEAQTLNMSSHMKQLWYLKRF